MASLDYKDDTSGQQKVSGSFARKHLRYKIYVYIHRYIYVHMHWFMSTYIHIQTHVHSPMHIYLYRRWYETGAHVFYLFPSLIRFLTSYEGLRIRWSQCASPQYASAAVRYLLWDLPSVTFGTSYHAYYLLLTTYHQASPLGRKCIRGST